MVAYIYAFFGNETNRFCLSLSINAASNPQINGIFLRVNQLMKRKRTSHSADVKKRTVWFAFVSHFRSIFISFFLSSSLSFGCSVWSSILDESVCINGQVCNGYNQTHIQRRRIKVFKSQAIQIKTCTHSPKASLFCRYL